VTQPVVALLGISGVGKSTVLNKLAGTIAFQHVQASTIIKLARDAQVATPTGLDELRNTNIDDNQALLISGFAAARDPTAPVVVLDGHSVIDTPQGLICIPPIVFARLGVSLFVFLADDAAAIADRRRQDQTRRRPTRTNDELERHQTEALCRRPSLERAAYGVLPDARRWHPVGTDTCRKDPDRVADSVQARSSRTIRAGLAVPHPTSLAAKMGAGPAIFVRE
jgi:adenylate kinase